MIKLPPKQFSPAGDKRESATQATAKVLTTKCEVGVLLKVVLNLIEKIENEGTANIFSIKVVRMLVQEYVSHLMQIISIGKYKEAIAESPYDGMFHLSIELNGWYILQNNEVIALSDRADAITEVSWKQWWWTFLWMLCNS